MTWNWLWQSRVAQVVITAVIVISLFSARAVKADGEHEHLVTDWSHHRIVYSEPHSLMQRFRLSTDPRYVQQMRRKSAERRGIGRDEWRWHHAPDDPDHIQGDWSMDMGAGATVGAGNYPAKFSFDPTSANCSTPTPPVGQQPDFVVYNTSQPGSSAQASIAAFTNIYSSCTGGTPKTYWAYNTGATGAVVTSPILSYDGSQVAFIESTPGAATLVILRWAAFSGTLTSPAVPTSGSCTALTAPCQTALTFSSQNSDANPTDTRSSPIYDYPTDTLYVGDASGFLHKFTGVFLGTPTEVVCTSTALTAGCSTPAGSSFWPAIVDPYGQLGSPVVLDGLNEVLLTDNQGVVGVVDMTVGGIDDAGTTTTIKLANLGFDDAPLVDLTTGLMYVFARSDLANLTGVYQLQIPALLDALDNATGPEVLVSTDTTNSASAFFDGTFDDDYYSTGGNGYLYACGTNGAANAVWWIPITSGVMGTPSLGPTLTTANVACSPITEFNNTATGNDRIFLSVAGSAITGDSIIQCPAASGCIMSFDVDSPLLFNSPTSATATVTGGTSGIIIDNSSSTVGASQVYFTPLSNQACTTSGGTGGCAIQASQSGLN